MRLKYLGLMALAGMLINTAPVSAHHSFAAEYDSKNLLTLTGTISKVEWTNPHIYIHLDVKDATGKVTTWALEGYPPNTLKRTGFPRGVLKDGDTVTITAYKAKDGSNTGAGREVTFKDGSKKFAGPVGN
ncbi:MAG: DUF6152 family protein [Acidobacteriota bacterium]